MWAEGERMRLYEGFKRIRSQLLLLCSGLMLISISAFTECFLTFTSIPYDCHFSPTFTISFGTMTRRTDGRGRKRSGDSASWVALSPAVERILWTEMTPQNARSLWSLMGRTGLHTQFPPTVSLSTAWRPLSASFFHFWLIARDAQGPSLLWSNVDTNYWIPWPVCGVHEVVTWNEYLLAKGQRSFVFPVKHIITRSIRRRKGGRRQWEVRHRTN